MPSGAQTLLGTSLEIADAFGEFSELMTSIQGRHFTPSTIFQILTAEIEEALVNDGNWKNRNQTSISICDPFAGDGRLVLSALETLYKNEDLGIRSATVELWDIQFESTNQILKNFEQLDLKYRKTTKVNLCTKNTFLDSNANQMRFDVVVTNPPWATVKPKRNKGVIHQTEAYTELTMALKRFDQLLESRFPFSQPNRKFAGWGTNLSRVGYELSLNLVAANGILAVVLPVSFLADEASSKLRKYVFSNLKLKTIDIYSAESKLFEFADVGVVTLVGIRNGENTSNLKVRWQEKEIDAKKANSNVEWIQFDGEYFGQSLPVNFGKFGIELQRILKGHSDFQSLENKQILWAGREIDETGLKSKLRDSGKYQIAKGGNISSFSILNNLPWLDITTENLPRSVGKLRIGWRDVSRASQKRRMIATLIPQDIVTGNSLNIAYLKTEPRKDFIYWLLAIMSSLVFEAQLRASLATDHVSLSAIRRILIPDFQDESYEEIVRLSKISLAEARILPSLECQVARAYKIDIAAWRSVIGAFPKLTEFERQALLNEWIKL